MIVIQVLLCFCYMCVIPYLIGCLFVDGQKDVGNVTILRTVAGLMISYAVYEILEVGFQLKNGSFPAFEPAFYTGIRVAGFCRRTARFLPQAWQAGSTAEKRYRFQKHRSVFCDRYLADRHTDFCYFMDGNTG